MSKFCFTSSRFSRTNFKSNIVSASFIMSYNLVF
nr:MAG TPA: hypothetical protein [Caudoviricetes sp.]